ncbi:MAG: AmmeMemoRadiSam system protein B, partial [Anaerolineales bacterium]|nr:AmmeMemoRadiSam system protein B [Anaerolineales bacterium]
GFACGHAAVAAVLHAARELGADRVQVLHYATSGDVTGDFSQVVGYGAAVVLKPATQPPQL